MVILVDTNVILDFLVKREPYFESAKKVMQLCAEEKVKGYVAFHSLPNIFYIMRKQYTEQKRREVLWKVCQVLEVACAEHKKVIEAIENDSFSDFEDCLQEKCAEQVKADYIVTRNIADYRESEIKAIEPDSLLQILNQ